MIGHWLLTVPGQLNLQLKFCTTYHSPISRGCGTPKYPVSGVWVANTMMPNPTTLSPQRMIACMHGHNNPPLLHSPCWKHPTYRKIPILLGIIMLKGRQILTIKRDAFSHVHCTSPSPRQIRTLCMGTPKLSQVRVTSLPTLQTPHTPQDISPL